MGSRNKPVGCLENCFQYLEDLPRWLFYSSCFIFFVIYLLFGVEIGLVRMVSITPPSRLRVTYSPTKDGFTVERKLGWYDQFGGYNATDYFIYFNLARRATMREAMVTCEKRGYKLLDVESLEEEVYVLYALNDIIENEYKGYRAKRMFTFWTGGNLKRPVNSLQTHLTWPDGSEMLYQHLCPDWHWPFLQNGSATFAIMFDAYREPSPQFGCWMPYPDQWKHVRNLFVCKRKRVEAKADSFLQAYLDEQKRQNDGATY